MTIANLKTKWNKEKDFYKKQEVGAGVQSFVKSCLESEELFNLKDGCLFKKNEFRKSEFVYEKKAVKEFVRVPKINEFNQPVKDEVIKRTEEMLALEDRILSDFVDFSKVMIQKINENNKLVEKTIEKNFNSEGLKFENKKIETSGIKMLSVIDFEKQKELKNYIDDLVFALYFNISLTKIGKSGLNKKEAVKKACVENRFYKLVNESTETNGL